MGNLAGHGMKALSWHELLEDAQTERQVVDVARHYLASHHLAIAQLPDECKPTRLVSAADINAYAVTLVRRHTEDASGGDDFLVRISAFFVQASMRLAELLPTSNDRDGTMEDSA